MKNNKCHFKSKKKVILFQKISICFDCPLFIKRIQSLFKQIMKKKLELFNHKMKNYFLETFELVISIKILDLIHIIAKELSRIPLLMFFINNITQMCCQKRIVQPLRSKSIYVNMMIIYPECDHCQVYCFTSNHATHV